MLNALAAAAMALASRLKTGGLIVNEHALTRDQLRVHVDALSRWFEFIHPNDLPARLGRRGKRPFCVLTLDDGYRSNATVIAPELERLGVPACFLVVTDFVSGQEPLWFDLYALLLKKLGTAPAGLSPCIVKQLPHDLVLERVRRACRQHGVRADMTDEDVAAMTWDDVRSLHRRGFAIGAHGETHSIMTRETRERAFASIAGSIARVAAETSSPCTSFAFPNGNYTAELARHAIECGVRMVWTTEPTWADGGFPLWRLPRVQLFGPQSRSRIELKIAAAATGRIVRNGDGTGMVYRAINRLGRRRAIESTIKRRSASSAWVCLSRGK